jgi:uncharacterized RDD family membrane protein YckC
MSAAAEQTAAAPALPAGAHCALHALREAAIVCARCGNFACRECEAELDGRRLCAGCLDRLSPLADPGRRLVAHLIDTYALMFSPFLLAFAGVGLSDNTAAAAASGSGLAILLLIGALQARMVRRYGQSIAKRWLRLRVVHADGRRMSFSRILFARNLLPALLGFLPGVGTLFSLLDALFVFGEERRTLHDRIAGSIVISVRSR